MQVRRLAEVLQSIIQLAMLVGAQPKLEGILGIDRDEPSGECCDRKTQRESHYNSAGGQASYSAPRLGAPRPSR